MEATLRIITENRSKKDLSYYEELIQIIQEKEFSNPDICIETCKAFIEGVSKTIILALDKSQRQDYIEKLTLEKLFKNAVEIIDKYNDDFETSLASRFGNIVQVIGEIRNRRGDISHGRPAPKTIESDSYLATLVKKLTDSFLEYILKHFFDIQLFEEELKYEELSIFNAYLDRLEGNRWSLSTYKYSEVLFEKEPVTYRNRYYDEFLVNGGEYIYEPAELTDEELMVITQSIESEIEKNAASTIVEYNFEPAVHQKIGDLAQRHNLDLDKLCDITDSYLRFDRKPDYQQIEQLAIEKIPLREKKQYIIDLKNELELFFYTIGR